ncbi:hypothetical protein CLOM_g13129 [Closterium sp. NIES-68]|nr:hypothetical protein CLOM_g13129 [Closterium sp. NIES-68]
MAELHGGAPFNSDHTFRSSQTDPGVNSEGFSNTVTGAADSDRIMLRVCTDPVNTVQDDAGELGAGGSWLGRSYSVQVERSGQAATARGAGGRRRSEEVGFVDISALDKALDRVMSMPWRGERADDRQRGEAEKGGRHVRERARSYGEGDESSALAAAAAAAAVAAATADGDAVGVALSDTAPPLQKCVKRGAHGEGEVDKDGRGDGGAVTVAEEASWQIDLRRVTIKKEIFKGAYSTVYKSTYRDMDVAVKAIDWGEAGSFSPLLRAKQRAALLRQVHVWRPLRNPYVTQLIGASISTDSTRCTTPRGVDARLRGVAGCLVMEYVGHLNLKEYLARANRERRKLPMHTLVDLAMQLAKGLAYIHSSGVVHGDVCPDNLLLTDRRRLKIAGFGVARFEADSKARGRSDRLDSSAGGQRDSGGAGGERESGGAGVVETGEEGGAGGEAAGSQQGCGWLPHDATGETGSAGYMAPEVLASEPYDRRADAYSFGICLWELLTCETPFDSFDFSEMASAISEGVRPILPPKCPPDLAHVMRCCWEGVPAARPSMPQVIEMLQKVNVFSGKEIPVHNI